MAQWLKPALDHPHLPKAVEGRFLSNNFSDLADQVA